MAVSTRTRAADIEEKPEGFIPSETHKKIYIVKNGVWTEDLVPIEQEEEDVSALAMEEEDKLMPSADWFDGRGQEFEYKWLSLDERQSGSARMKGWNPVPPDKYKDPRYKVKD